MADRVMLAAMFAGTAMLAGVATADSADPTRPPAGFSEHPDATVPVQQEAPLVVSSLFLMGTKPYAVVDGQIVRPGDPLGGGRIAKIDANGIWISIPGRDKTRSGTRQLKWLPDIVKTPAKASPSARMEKK